MSVKKLDVMLEKFKSRGGIRIPISLKLVILPFVACFFLGFLVSGYTAYELNKVAEKSAFDTVNRSMSVAWQLLYHQGIDFRIEDGKLYAGNTVVNGNLELVDSVSNLTGGSATYFMGDMRVATNVKKSDGSRAVGTQLARNAAWQSIFDQKKPYRGIIDVLGTAYITGYDPIFDAKNNVIGIVYVGYAYQEFFADAKRVIYWSIALIFLACLVMSLISAYIIHRWIGVPVKTLSTAIANVMEQRELRQIRYLKRNDEIGDIALAVDSLRRSIAERQKLEEEKFESQSQTLQKQTLLVENTMKFVAEIEQIVSNLVDTSILIKESANFVAKASDDTAKLSIDVTEASAHTSRNVGTVASGAEELTVSIKEIERQISSASQLTVNAVKHADVAADIISSLADASQKINAIVSLINDIASRTNLLALNATIEAARAGDYGKGFAVVASEVKALANQTARATEDIERKVEGMQIKSKNAVSAVQAITKAIDVLAEITESVAAAVTEQSAATQEISRNVNEAALEVQIVSDDIIKVNHAASSTESSADTLSSASLSMANIADRLKNEVNNYVQQTI